MHSLRGGRLLVLGSVVGVVRSGVLPTPAITAAPRSVEIDVPSLEQRQDPDAISLAKLLLTALPQSLRQIAATNIPAVSSILWEEFLDDKKPEWFLELPWDIQSYLIRNFGPSTAWPTAPPTSDSWNGGVTTTAASNPAETSAQPTSGSSPSSALDSASASASNSRALSSRSSSATSASTLSTRASRASSSPTSSSTSDPEAPAANNEGLSRKQKIGLGVGLPFGLIGAAAVLFGCCFLLRRRKKKHIEGSQPPSSPGFIPRFSFQDRAYSSDHFEHRAPLNPGYHQESTQYNGAAWEDEGYDPADMEPPHRASTFPPTSQPMAMHDAAPIMAPALYHTHSSNRARGKRTSYTSLRSVAELTEPDEEMESPILGRHQTPPRQGTRRTSLPMPSVMEVPPAVAAATIKRKPVPTSSAEPPQEQTSRNLLRPQLTIPNNSGSSSSGLALSANSSRSGHLNRSQPELASPVSPLSNYGATPTTKPKNPFAGGYDYLEDYGPEFSHDGYNDVEDGLYGGNRSLDRYPEPAPRRNSKTEWPLRNVMGSGHRRNKSPLWDRVYER